MLCSFSIHDALKNPDVLLAYADDDNTPSEALALQSSSTSVDFQTAALKNPDVLRPYADGDNAPGEALASQSYLDFQTAGNVAPIEDSIGKCRVPNNFGALV
jgi:hypothetical protein